MDNRTNVDELLREIERRNKTLLWNKDMKVSQLQGVAGVKNKYKQLGDMFALDSVRLAIFNRRFSNPVDDLPPLGVLFGVLASVQRLDKSSPPEIKLYVKSAMLCLVHVVRFISGYVESNRKILRYRQAFYNRIGDLDQDNIFRKIFMSEYSCDSLCGEEIEERLMEEVIAEYRKTVRYSDEVCHDMDNNKSAKSDFVRGVLEEWDKQYLLSVTNYQNKKRVRSA